jgi:hypothetical protein
LKPKFTEYKNGSDKNSKQKFSVLLQSKESHKFTKRKSGNRQGVFQISKGVGLCHLVETYRRFEEMWCIHIQRYED